MPFPQDYGGAIDVFNKVKSLHAAGISIYLHCFTKGRKPAETLNQFCKEVYYYPRNKFAFSYHLPYMVSSRNHKELLVNLSKDNHPVLFEGVQCSYLLYKDALAGRKLFLRLHNVECNYYKKLAGYESNPAKKYFFNWQSRLLKKYETSIANKAAVLAISEDDAAFYKKQFNAKQVFILPAFAGWEKLQGKEERGLFCLYHGNLAINENEKVAEWLIHIFKEIKIPLVIAGKNPANKLEKLIHHYPNTCLVKNPSDRELEDLIQKAQVNVMPSFNNTGIKLKLVHALYSGKHCLVNAAAVAGSGLEELCTIAGNTGDFAEEAIKLYHLPFIKHEERELKLRSLYNNDLNAARLIAWIY